MASTAVPPGLKRRSPLVATKDSMRLQSGLGYRVLFNGFSTWTPHVSGTASCDLADVDNFAAGKGTTCLRLTTGGDSAGSSYVNSGLFSAALDFTGAHPVIALKVTDGTKLHSNGFSLFLGSDAVNGTFTNQFKFNFSQNSGTSYYLTPDGSWLLIALTWAQATQDGSPNRAAITQIQFKANDNHATVPGNSATVRLGMVAIARDNTMACPNGAIVLSFDDGTVDQYNLAYPILREFGVPAIMYVIDEYIQSANAGFLSVVQVNEMRASGLVSIGFHASTANAHTQRYPTLGGAAASADLAASKSYHQAQGWFDPVSGEGNYFAWPGGEWNADVYSAVSALGFRAMRTTFSSASGLYQESMPPSRPLALTCGSSTGVLTSLALKKAYMDVVKANKAIGFMTEHVLQTTATNGNGFNNLEFEQLLAYGAAQGIKFLRMDQVLP